MGLAHDRFGAGQIATRTQGKGFQLQGVAIGGRALKAHFGEAERRRQVAGFEAWRPWRTSGCGLMTMS